MVIDLGKMSDYQSVFPASFLANLNDWTAGSTWLWLAGGSHAEGEIVAKLVVGVTTSQPVAEYRLEGRLATGTPVYYICLHSALVSCNSVVQRYAVIAMWPLLPWPCSLAYSPPPHTILFSQNVQRQQISRPQPMALVYG